MKKLREKKSAKKLIDEKRGAPRIKKQKQSAGELSPGKSNGNKPVGKDAVPGFRKQYLKSNGSCNVTFRLPKEAAPDARVVTIVGDFNEWNVSDSKMKRLKSGDFKVTLKLSSDREYRFRYLIDNDRWENDWHADGYVSNSFGCDDSLVVV